jgi:hypothetical protein
VPRKPERRPSALDANSGVEALSADWPPPQADIIASVITDKHPPMGGSFAALVGMGAEAGFGEWVHFGVNLTRLKRNTRAIALLAKSCLERVETRRIGNESAVARYTSDVECRRSARSRLPVSSCYDQMQRIARCSIRIRNAVRVSKGFVVAQVVCFVVRLGGEDEAD